MRSSAVYRNFSLSPHMRAVMRLADVNHTCICHQALIPCYTANNSRVSEAAVHIKDRLIILSTSRIPWKHTFESMTLDFGDATECLTPRRHDNLRPRQAAATSAAASSTTDAYPAAPTSTPKQSNVTASFNLSLIDKAILPPDPSLSVHGPKM